MALFNNPLTGHVGDEPVLIVGRDDPHSWVVITADGTWRRVDAAEPLTFDYRYVDGQWWVNPEATVVADLSTEET